MNNKTNETIFRENYSDSLKTVRIEAPEDVRLVPVGRKVDLLKGDVAS